VSRLATLARRYWFDALIVVGIGISIAIAVVGQGRKNGPEGPMWLDIVLAVIIAGPLLLRRRFPFGAPVGVGAGVVIASFADNSLVPFDFISFLAGCAAVFLLAQRRDWRQAVAGLAMAVGVEAIVVRNDPRGQIGQFVFVSLIFLVVWVVGFTLGRKFAEADEAKERAARAEREREALLIVERTGREALAEMRRLVGVLRRPEEAPALAPQPSLEHVERLVEQTCEAGLPVELRVEGEATELPAGLDLTAYRLVQEGLTNALKHARATRAEVVVNYGDGQIEVTVSDDGAGVGNGDGGGHGLVGMRERVSVYGGELDAGPQPGGGYRLRARLPLPS
jgi:signal transduction histidine kinase